MIGEETIDGEHASWGDLPSGWSSAELPVVDAVSSVADAELENEAAVKGSIVLVTTSFSCFFLYIPHEWG